MNHLARAVMFAAVIYQFAGCSPQLVPRAGTSGVSSAPPEVLAPAESPSTVVRDFKTFALNALLLPLLDDDVPTRWADPSFSVDCDDARVRVDGDRLDVGSPVPDAFTVRWNMKSCTPMGQGIEVSGDVELRVETNPHGYSASVHPKGLSVRTTAGVHSIHEPFTALLAVVDSQRP
jgi:hypothetical protein